MKTLLSHKESKTKDGIRVTIEIAINQSNHVYLSVCGEVHEMTSKKDKKVRHHTGEQAPHDDTP